VGLKDGKDNLLLLQGYHILMGDIVTGRQFPEVYHIKADKLVDGKPGFTVILIQPGLGFAVNIRHGRQIFG
jgi:hypothetical protein